jgi:nucleotide-binding universal stress UspA family protein
MLPIKTILHPTDFSEPAMLAFNLACALARDYGARLIVQHVEVPPVYVHGEAIVPLEPPEADSALYEQLKSIRPTDPNIPIEYLLTRGDVVEDILKVADQAHANLIVMGTHGRGPIMRFLMGSVAEQVVRKAPCPVLTVKKPAPPESATAVRDDNAAVTGNLSGSILP